MPTNYQVVKTQLQLLQKRLRKDPESMQPYEKLLTMTWKLTTSSRLPSSAHSRI